MSRKNPLVKRWIYFKLAGCRVYKHPKVGEMHVHSIFGREVMYVYQMNPNAYMYEVSYEKAMQIMDCTSGLQAMKIVRTP